MDFTAQPLRSVLYLPASNARAIDKARSLDCDAIIFDLEDAVSPDAKLDARETLARELRAGGFGHRARIVRVNGYDTDWGHDDVKALAPLSPDAVLLPKVNWAGDIEALVRQLDGIAGCESTVVWAMMETAQGVLNAAEIARAPRMAGFVMGTNDLAAELGCAARPDRMPLMVALQTCLMAARIAKLRCLDGVFNALRDADGLRAECEQGRDLGMDGKTLIHPAQIAVANEVFSPSADEVALARRQIDAWEQARASGAGVAVVDGRIVENLHVDTARDVLVRAGALERQGETA